MTSQPHRWLLRWLFVVFATVLVLPPSLCAQSEEYVWSDTVAGFSRINNRGDLAAAWYPGYDAETFEPIPDSIDIAIQPVGGTGADIQFHVGLIPGGHQPSGDWGIFFNDAGEVLVNFQDFDTVIDDQIAAGAGILRNGVFQLIDDQSPSSWFYGFSEAGHAVGYRHVLGLGHTRTFRPSPGADFVTVPVYTAVAVAVAPDGTAREVPLPEGYAYGYRFQAEDWHLIRDNQSWLRGVNRHGVACGSATHVDPTIPGREITGRRFSYSILYDFKSHSTTRIEGAPEGASDINDHGVVVGAAPGEGTWIHSGGGSASFISDRGGTPRINNRGQVIWHSGFSHPDSVIFWDRGRLRDIRQLVPEAPFSISSIEDINDQGQLLVVTTDFERRVLSPSPVRIEIDPDRVLEKDERFAADIVITHFGSERATYTFTGDLLSVEPLEQVTIGEIDAAKSFTMSEPGEERVITVPVVASKYGAFSLSTSVAMTRSGETTTYTPAVRGLVTPLPVELTITTEKYQLNQTPESAWGPRAREFNDLLRTTAEEPYTNLIEIEMEITNRSDKVIENVNIPEALDVLSFISSTDLESPGVPLAPIRFYPPTGPPIDLSDPQEEPDIKDVVLNPGESTTFAWLVDAFDIDPAADSNDSAELEFKALVLASLDGENLQTLVEQEFKIIDKIEFDVSPEGGIRGYAPIPTDWDRVSTIIAYVDLDEDDKPSEGESTPVSDVRMGRDGLGRPIVYFTPPTYKEEGWPELGPGPSQSVQLWGTNPEGEGENLEAKLAYRNDIVREIETIREGMEIAFDEALFGKQAQANLREWGVIAGARAEVILKQALSRAAASQSERTAITALLEEMPWKLADYLRKQPSITHKAMALPVTFGQAYDAKPIALEHTVLMTLATGTLCLADGLAPDLHSVSAQPSGGDLWLPGNLDGAPFSVDRDEGHGWQFDWRLDPVNGVIVENVLAHSLSAVPRRTKPDWVIGDWMQTVVRKISTPAIEVGNGQYVDLRKDWLSHIYINRHVEPNFGRTEHGGDRHGPTDGWALAAQYRIPLNGEPETGNEARQALVARQTYTMSNVYSDFEPAHCAQAASLYPQVSFTISSPRNETSPNAVKTTCRMALNPQEASEQENRYAAGLFADKDYPKYWASSSAPGAKVTCGPVPFWWNMFERDNTVPQVETEIIFDTDHKNEIYDYISPDNAHFHRVRTGKIIPNKYTEAPGSFDGTIHFHWRWGEAFGRAFGNGETLIPDDQTWVMGVARKDFPDDFEDFTQLMAGSQVKEQEKVLLVRSEQTGVVGNRQYHTFTTGFANALGPHSGCLLVALGTDVLGGYVALWPGFYNTPAGLAARALEYELLDRLIERRENFDPDDTNYFSTTWILEKAFHATTRIYPSLEQCLAAEGVETHDHAGELVVARQEKAETSDEGNVKVVRFGLDEADLETPRSVEHASFIGTSEPEGYVVDQSIFPNSLGYWIYQRPESPNNPLKISFEEPVRQIHNLAVGLRSSTVSENVIINMFSGDALVDSKEFLLEKENDGEIMSRMVLLDPGQAFDNITVTPRTPDSLLAVGAMILAEEAIALGDFNMDGEVNGIDGELFSLAYSGEGGFLPFWAADADADNDGDIDVTDYETFAHLFPCLIGINMMPSLSQDAIATGESKRFEVVARSLGEAGPVFYEWTATAGTFDDPTSSMPEWKAPGSIETDRVEVVIRVRIQSAGCNPRVLTINQPVIERPAATDESYASWSALYGLEGANALPLADADGDRFPNLIEYAMDTSPMSKSSVPAWPTPTVDQTGLVTLRIPKPPGREGVNYRAQWSRGLQEWDELGLVVVEDSATQLIIQLPAEGDNAYLRLSISLTD